MNFERVLGGPYMNRKFSAGQRRLPPAQAITTEYRIVFMPNKCCTRTPHFSAVSLLSFNVLLYHWIFIHRLNRNLVYQKIIFRELQLIFDTENWVWKLKKCLLLMAPCALILSNIEKSLGSHECGPKGLSNFGCLPWKCFPLNNYNANCIL